MINRKVAVQEILVKLGKEVLRVYGAPEGKFIDNLSDPEHTTKTTLDWVKESNEKKQLIVESTKAETIVVDPQVAYSDLIRSQNKTLIVVERPRNAIAVIGNAFFAPQQKPGIHPSAVIDERAIIGKNVSIGPYCVIGDVVIGDNTIINSFVKIHSGTKIGRNCVISDNVVLGDAGFGFEKDSCGNWFRFPQIGGLIVGDYVEIGAFSSIDRGALSDTIVGDYAKIDSHVKIAHNNKIGRNVVITASVMISGSNVIEDDVWIAPNSSIAEWGKIGKGSFVGIGSVVIRKLKENSKVLGNPAKIINF